MIFMEWSLVLTPLILQDHFSHMLSMQPYSPRAMLPRDSPTFLLLPTQNVEVFSYINLTFPHAGHYPPPGRGPSSSRSKFPTYCGRLLCRYDVSVACQPNLVSSPSNFGPERFGRFHVRHFKSSADSDLTMGIRRTHRSPLASPLLVMSSFTVALLPRSSSPLILSWNTWSICSRSLPQVSGTKKNVQNKDSRQKTAKKVQAKNPVFCSGRGVITPYTTRLVTAAVLGYFCLR